MLKATPLIKINKYFSYVIYKPICGGMSQGTQKNTTKDFKVSMPCVYVY